jgi:FRG domain
MDEVIRTVSDLFRIFDHADFLRFASFTPDPERPTKAPRYGDNFGTWFRGQPDSEWPLEPSIFRRDISLDEGLSYWILRLDSAEHRATCKTTFDWLCLMRHHLLPTRLLDWSENALVALYMACEAQSKFDTDGTLWALNTLKLHETSRPRHLESVAICLPNLAEVSLRAQMATESDRVAYLNAISRLDAESAWDGLTLNEYRNRLSGSDQERDEALRELATPVAVYPYRFRGRMAAQHSVFTLHGGKAVVDRHISPNDVMLPAPVGLNELSTKAKPERQFLLELLIPSDAKQKILDELSRVGINEKTLFPEMDSAVRHMRRAFASLK